MEVMKPVSDLGILSRHPQYTCEGPDGHPTLFGRLRLDWVVLLGRVQEMVAFI